MWPVITAAIDGSMPNRAMDDSTPRIPHTIDAMLSPWAIEGAAVICTGYPDFEA
jgi:hypothetical protein